MFCASWASRPAAYNDIKNSLKKCVPLLVPASGPGLLSSTPARMYSESYVLLILSFVSIVTRTFSSLLNMTQL